MKKILTLLAISFAMRVTANAQPQQRLPDGVQAHRDIAYVENGHERQKLDLYVPEKAGAPLPLIIWIHGGGWAAGSKDNCPPLRGGYTGRGYAVASIGYRLSGHAIFPAQIEDCKAAIRWLRAHAKEYNLDPKRFGVWGSSSGGHLVALTGTSGEVKDFDVGANLDQSSRVQAVCDYFGPTDLTQMDAHALADAPFKHDSADSPESKLIGGAVQASKDKAARVNPITYVSSDDPPFLIVHGDKDPLVPHHQSEILFDALKKAGVSVRFHTIHGAGHGGPGFAGKNIDEMVSTFFDERLKGSPAKSDALTTESTADPASTARDPRANMPARPNAPAPAAQRRGPAWEAVLARDDKNHDGKVSREEFSGPKPLFDHIDADHDGFITREEHEAFIATKNGAHPENQRPQSAPQK